MRNTKPIVYNDSFALTPKQLRRFWSKVEKTDGCWIWKGGVNSRYGRMKVDGKMIKTHRISFLIHGGIMTAERPFICHTCDNPICVNPKHLWAGTCDENLKDMVAKGRSTRGVSFNAGRKGETNPKAKLTESDVIKIRSGFSKNPPTRVNETARKYGVTHHLISLIRDRKIWTHI